MTEGRFWVEVDVLTSFEDTGDAPMDGAWHPLRAFRPKGVSMVILLVLYFLLLLFFATRATVVSSRAWRSGDRQSAVAYGLTALYLWYRVFALGLMLWDIIAGLFALLFIVRRRMLRF